MNATNFQGIAVRYTVNGEVAFQGVATKVEAGWVGILQADGRYDEAPARMVKEMDAVQLCGFIRDAVKAMAAGQVSAKSKEAVKLAVADLNRRDANLAESFAAALAEHMGITA